MSEQSHERGEAQKIDRAVLRFKNDLNLSGRSYVDALFATQRFVESDFKINEEKSMAYLMELESERALPSADMYNYDSEHALEIHRLAMYAKWMPLYRETHSSHEFDDWLPGAIDIMLPPDGRHTGEECYSFTVEPEKTSVMDIACPLSTICPLKYITNDLLLNAPYQPLSEEELIVIDSRKVRTDANILLRRMCEKKIITHDQLRRAAVYYRRTYDELGM